MIAAIVLMVLVFIGAGVAVAVHLRKPRIQWVKIPSGGGAQFANDPHVDPVRLEQAFLRARELLWRGTNFPPDRVQTALANVSIKVMPVDSWLNAAGQKVGGEVTVPFCPTVCRDLSSLFHELVHVVEFSATGMTDDAHEQWESRGVWRADAEFRAWLDSSPDSRS